MPIPAAAAPSLGSDDLLSIFNAQPGATLLLSPEWVILGASDDYLAATLTERSTLVGQFLFDAFPENPETPEANGAATVRASLETVLATGQPHDMAPLHYDVPDPSRPGHFVERHWKPRTTPVLDARRQVRFIIQTVQDITDSRVAEQQLRDSQAAEQAARADADEQRAALGRAFEQAPVSIAILRGAEFVVELANPSLGALWGRPVGPALGRPLFEALPDLAGQGLEELLAQALRTGEPLVFRERPTRLARDPGGPPALGYYNFTYQPLHDAQGQVTGIITVGLDVTEQVVARQQLQQLNQELEARVQERTRQIHEQGQRLERLFMQAPAAICIFGGPDLVFELVNPIYQQFFPERPLLGKPLLEALPELTGHAAYHTMRRVFDTGESVSQQALHTPLARTADGELEDRYFNYVQQPRYDEQGRVDGVLVFGFEVTELVHARQQAEALQAQVLAEAQRRGQERETFYRIFEQTPALVALLRAPYHRYEYVNPAYQALFPGRDLVGRDVAEAVPELTEQGFVDLLDQVYRSGETYFGQEMAFTPQLITGEAPRTNYYNFTFQAYREQGEVAGISIFAFDATEQVRARRVIEESEQQVRTMVENAPFLMGMYVGPELRFHLANQVMLDGLGKGNDVIGQRYADVVPEMENYAVIEQMQQVLATGKALHLRNQRLEVVMHGTPQTFYYNYSFIPLRDADGHVYGILNTADDVTDLALARQRLESYAAELQESEARFRTMADAAPNMVWAVHPDSSIRYINRAFLDFVGLDTEQQYIATGWVPYLHPDELELTQHTLSEAIAQRQPYVLEHRMRRHDGQYRWLLAQGAPSYLANGELYGYVGSAIDITALKQTNEQLQRTNQDLDNFVYAASHDLKQPVNNLVGLFEELRRGSTFADPAEEQLLVPLVGEALQQLSLTIDDLAALGQAQQTSLAPPELVSLDDLTEEVVNTLEPQMRAARARVTTDFSSWPALSFARANLRIILLNLLGNSLKYADPARPARIHVSVWVEQGCPVLIVEDNGLGFDADKHGAELFQLFRRLHTHTSGTGVGLYLVHRIVEANGGSIEVDSQPGEGATFRIRFWLN